MIAKGPWDEAWPEGVLGRRLWLVALKSQPARSVGFRGFQATECFRVRSSGGTNLQLATTEDSSPDR